MAVVASKTKAESSRIETRCWNRAVLELLLLGLCFRLFGGRLALALSLSLLDEGTARSEKAGHLSLNASVARRCR